MASDKSRPAVSGKRSARAEDNFSNVVGQVKLETPETETLELQSYSTDIADEEPNRRNMVFPTTTSGNDFNAKVGENCNTLDSSSNNQRRIVSNTDGGMNDIKKIKLETPELETANADGNIQQMLQNQPLFKCSYEGCHYRTKGYSDFKSHQNEHQTIRFICPFEGCSDSYSHRSEFSRHIRRVHTKKSILSGGHFEEDYRRIHRIKNAVPDNPSISTIDSRDQEVVIAAGDIQVKLETPEQQILEFPSQSSHLKVHQDVHSDERPYQCSLCEKSFKTVFNLNIHQKIHKIQVEYSLAANSSTKNLNKLIRKETPLLSCDFDGCQFSTYKQGHLSVHLIRAHRTKNSFTETSFNQPLTIDANVKVGNEVVKTPNASQVKLETPELETIELPSINSADCDQNSGFSLSSSGSDIDHNDSDSEVVDEDCNDDGKDNGSVRFECSFEGCSASFSLKNSLSQHVRIVHKKKAPLLRCEFEGCQYSTRRSSVFRTHRAVHSDERPYICPHCELTFKTASNLWAHKKIHDEQPQFRCELEGCDYATHHSSSLCAHQKSIHERNGSIKIKRFQCQFDDCTASYSRKENLCAHIRIVHKKSAPLLCCDFEGCDYSTYKNKNMQDHRNVHQGIRFKCSFEGCSADYSSNASLLAHQQIVHEKKATLLRCDFEGCSFSTRRSSVFKVHQAVHSDERPYKCPHCEQSFKTASILWGHKRTHGEKPRYKCHWEGCDFTASLSANFREHLKSVHGTNDEELNGPRFECQFEGCTANYSTKTNLTKHVRIVHKKEAPLLRCQFDGCSFTTRITHHFKNHQTVHSDERPFKCPHCEQTYKTRANLWVHKKIHETKAANLKCDWEGCNFAAHKLSQLREHRQSIHLTSSLGTAGQRFQCNFESCSAKFSSRKQFNLHIRVVHTKEEPSSP